MCTDMKKSVGLPAPIDPFRVQLGPHFEDCNPSSEFNMDDQVSKRFHELFADKHGCHIPFLGGDRYVTMVSPQSVFCTKGRHPNKKNFLIRALPESGGVGFFFTLARIFWTPFCDQLIAPKR